MFFESILEDDSVLCDDKFPVSNPVQDQRDERNKNKEYNDIENRIAKDERESVFDEISANPCIQYERDKVDQCLLVIEIKSILEDFSSAFHGS